MPAPFRGNQIPDDRTLTENKKKQKNPRSQLIVTLSSCEFVKDFNYFIAVQLDKDGVKVKKYFFKNLLEKNGGLSGCR